MRRAIERDDLLDEELPSRDLVLGAPALLGIFFALALICAVCFGFGYSSGHGWRKPSASPSAAATPVDGSKRSLAHPVPLGGSGPENNATDVDQPAADASSLKPSPGASAAQPAASVAEATASPTEQAGFPPNYVVPDAARPPADEPPKAGIQADGTNLMVQIAAVSRAADAETLAGALRHDGFAAMVRTSTTDNYFHVQVGPFSTLAAAKAMRARLADGGYNAFIKP